MKVSVIGLGHVGATIAFSIVAKGLVDELVLVNRNQDKAIGEAADLQHAAAFSPRKIQIRAGKISDTRQSDVVILCISLPSSATTPIPPPRDQMAIQNTALYRQWIPPLALVNPDAVFIMVSNPVDILSYVAWKASELPSHRMIGTGTLIDSARYRSYLSEHLQIHPDDIRAYVLGEHGDTQFPALSVALTGGEKLDDSPQIEQFFQKTVQSGYDVYKIKGYTNYAIALSTCMILDAIVHNSHRTLPVSTLIDGFCSVSDVFLSIPCVVGRNGIVRQLRPPMNDREVLRFQESAAKLKSTLSKLPTDERTEPFPQELL